MSSNNAITNAMPRQEVVTLFGYGIDVRVDRGHLLVKDGIGAERREVRFPRVGHGLKRLVVIGSDGLVSLAALRWLADQDVSFSLLERDGKVLATTGPVRPSDARLRRAQALAVQTGQALELARELIAQKLDGQAKVAREKLLDTTTARTISEFRARLANADSPEAIRLLEALAGRSYWSAWHNLPINFPKSDLHRVPDHWQTFGTRISPLTGSPRSAANPANAILNYLYAVLESEARLAAAALGLDPGLGVLHADGKVRDSLACDLMEPVRAQIDAFVAGWVTRDTLKREWFLEQRDGNCRLMAPLAVRLAETAPTWGRAVAPFAEWFAQSLWNSTRKPVRSENSLPTRLTQRRRTEGRGKEFSFHVKPAQQPLRVCAACGAVTRRGQRCAKCGREISGKKLIELARVGRVVAQKPEAQEKRSHTQLHHEAGKRAWRSSPKPDWPDEKSYLEGIRPRLGSVTISAIAAELGVSESYAADIRVGRRRPHPRHWQALALLAGCLSNTNQR